MNHALLDRELLDHVSWTSTARVAPDLQKALAILWDTTERRSSVGREDLKLYWKSEKSLHFSRMETTFM